MSRHTATDSSEDERSEFELGGRRELRVLGNEIRLVAMRPGVTPVLIPNTKVKAWAADGTALETVWESRWLPDFKFLMNTSRRRSMNLEFKSFFQAKRERTSSNKHYTFSVRAKLERK